jgi:hypothetical protein
MSRIIFIFLFILGLFTHVSAQQSSLQVNLTGDISGSYLFENMDYGRVNNSKVNLPPTSTLGLFSVPINSSVDNLEIAVVIANATGMPLEPGSYAMVRVENENPVLQALPKQGFMTLVALRNGIAADEYYTVSGSVDVTEVSSTSLKATFSTVMETATGGKRVTASGSFTVVF